MKYFIKQAVLPIIYTVLMAVTAIGVMCLNENVTWLKVIFLFVNLGLYAYVVGTMAFKDGQDAFNTREANDAERRIIVETGEDRVLKEDEEYKPWKGFVVGLTTCAPLIILFLLQIILDIFGAGTNIPEILATYIYMMISSLVHLAGFKSIAWIFIFSVLFICSCTGIPYIFGAIKVERQKRLIQEKHHKIYGQDK